MKKIISMFLAVCVLLLAGCRDYSGEEIENTPAQGLFPDFKYDSSISPYYQSDNRSIAVAENGYYFNVNGSTKKIYYYDVNSGTVIPLCSQIGCTHSTKECDACFEEIKNGQEADTSGFTYYNHRLYMISYDEKNGTKLVSYNEQGLERREDMVLYSDPNFVPVSGADKFCIFGGYVYFWLEKFDNSDMIAKFRLYQMPINGEGKPKEMVCVNITREEYDTFMRDPALRLHPTEETLYILTEEFDIVNDKKTYKLYSKKKSDEAVNYVLNSELPRKISDYTEDADYINLADICFDNNNNLYYVNYVRNEKTGSRVYSYNFDTKEKKLVYSVEADDVSIMCDDQYIYVSVCKGTSGLEHGRIVILDKNCNIKYQREIKRSEQDASQYKGGYADATFVGVDERYVIIKCHYISDFDFNGETVSEKLYNGDTIYYMKPADNNKLAMMLKSDIGTGNEKWIQMYDGMNIQE